MSSDYGSISAGKVTYFSYSPEKYPLQLSFLSAKPASRDIDVKKVIHAEQVQACADSKSLLKKSINWIAKEEESCHQTIAKAFLDSIHYLFLFDHH